MHTLTKRGLEEMVHLYLNFVNATQNHAQTMRFLLSKGRLVVMDAACRHSTSTLPNIETCRVLEGEGRGFLATLPGKQLALKWVCGRHRKAPGSAHYQPRLGPRNTPISRGLGAFLGGAWY